MNKGGRKKDPIWEMFYEVEEDGKVKAKCKLCNHVQSTKACRMRSHVKNCKENMAKTGNDTALVVEDEISGIIDLDNPESDKSTTTASESENITKKRKVQASMNDFCIKTAGSEKEELDKLLAMFFYSASVPFSHVENEYFKAFVSKLRPGYKLPSRKAMSGPILDTVHNALQNKMAKSLKGNTASLLIDGWSNIHNEPITVASVYCEGKNYFLEAIDSHDNQKTSTYLTSLSKDFIKKANEKYDCQIKTVVTDNTNNMKKMRENLENCEELDLLTYGCSTHYLNLLGQDITPKSIITPVVTVNKYFRNHHLPGAWLRDCDKTVKPQIPGDTRWNSQIVCLKTYVKNHAAFLSIINEHSNEIDTTIAKFIRDFNLYKQVKDVIQQLTPISVALDRLQRDNANVADACSEWLELLNTDELKPHNATLMKRFQSAIKPLHMFAYLMHPKYQGEKLNAAQKELARDWLKRKNADYLPYIICFETESEPYPKTYFNDSICKQMDPVIWWKGISKCKNVPAEFCDCILTLLGSPASTSGLERIFSSFSFVHSKLRNKLGLNTAAKILFCYNMLHH